MFLGKTNCDEFAMGSSNENSAYGPVRNPVALDRVPGGSSGGSAAAVAAGLAVVSLGTDTGGSIRQPGACCGIPGLMPTYGRVSRYGLVAFASSLDKIGPFATNIADAAAVLSVIAGHDPHDSTSAAVPVQDYAAEIEKPVQGLRIGVPEDYFGAGLDPEVKEKVQAGIALLERLGCRADSAADAAHGFRDCRLLHYCHGGGELESGTIRRRALWSARAGGDAERDVPEDSLARLRRRSEAAESCWERMCSPPATTTRIICGRRRSRSLIARDFADAFQKVDAIVTPTAPTPGLSTGREDGRSATDVSC